MKAEPKVSTFFSCCHIYTYSIKKKRVFKPGLGLVFGVIKNYGFKPELGSNKSMLLAG